MSEYLEVHNALYELFNKAYADLFLLKEIDESSRDLHEKDKALIEASHDVIAYLTELIKADLALTLYKIGMDQSNDGRKLNLNRLRREATEVFTKKSIKHISTPKEFQTIEKQINRMRNSFLAHEEFDRESQIIQVSDMELLLEQYRTFFECLTFRDEYPDIKELSKSVIEGIHMHMSMGLRFIIERASFDIKN